MSLGSQGLKLRSESEIRQHYGLVRVELVDTCQSAHMLALKRPRLLRLNISATKGIFYLYFASRAFNCKSEQFCILLLDLDLVMMPRTSLAGVPSRVTALPYVGFHHFTIRQLRQRVSDYTPADYYYFVNY